MIKTFIKRLLPVWVMLCAVTFGAGFASAQSNSGPNMTYSYSGPRITDDDVYRNPDDRQLNLNYARQQAAKGELLSASAALERLLYQEPNWHSARLFYAAVLYRLDDRKAAKRELDLLRGRNLNDQQIIVLEDYKTAFQDAPPVTAQTTIDGKSVSVAAAKAQNVKIANKKAAAIAAQPLSGRIALGVRTDDNAGNALTDISFNSNERPDESVFAQGALRASMPVGDGAIMAHASVNGQLRRHETYSEADYDTVGLRLGASVSQDKLKILAEVQADQVNISSESYLLQMGPRIVATYDATDSVQLSLSGALYNQNFDNLTIAPAEEVRSGNKNVVLAAISKKFNDRLKVSANAGIENKTAQDQRLSYDGVRAGLSLTQDIANDMQIKAQAGFRRLDYSEGGGPALFAGAVKEDRVNARLSFGVPVTKFISGEAGSELLEGVKLEAAVNYNRREIDGPGPDFDNLGAELRLTLDF